MPNASELDKIAVADIDVKDGDLVNFVDAGQFVEFKQKDGSIRTRLKIQIECVEGQIKELTLNETSRKALINGYGKMTEDWVGLSGLASVVTQNVGGELKKVIYLSAVKGAPKKKVAAPAVPGVEEREPGEEG